MHDIYNMASLYLPMYNNTYYLANYLVFASALKKPALMFDIYYYQSPSNKKNVFVSHLQGFGFKSRLGQTKYLKTGTQQYGKDRKRVQSTYEKFALNRELSCQPPRRSTN